MTAAKDQMIACAADGGAALAGVSSAALSEDARAELSRMQKLVRVIDLPTHPSFNDEFVDGMMFE